MRSDSSHSASSRRLDGTTNEDRTNYFETLPSNRLELALWLESDRMGFLLPALTQAKLDNQRDVVKNERRQNYDNRPYGRVREAVMAALYPPEHPLSWLTIGSMEDLDRATLADVERFFRAWYGPSNATSPPSASVAAEEAFALAERWFGALPPIRAVPAVERRPSGLARSARLLQEDRIEVPQLTLAWPTVPAWHPDEPALNLLSEVLSANRASVLDKALCIDEELASAVSISHRALEVDGQLVLQVRPRPGVALGRLEERVDELLAGVLARGVEDQHLLRLAARRQGLIARGLDTVSARTATLGHYNLFRGDPGALAADVERHARVVPADVVGALARYVDGRPRIALSTVPEGRPELAA